MAAKWERQSQKRNLSSRTSCRIFREKIRILCKEWLSYLDALNFVAAPLQGPWFSPFPCLTRRQPESDTRPSHRRKCDTISCQALVLFRDAPFPPPDPRPYPAWSHCTACHCSTLEGCLSLECSGPLSLTCSQSLTKLILCHVIPSTPWQFVTPSSRLLQHFVRGLINML